LVISVAISGQLLLHQLERCDRLAELDARFRVLERAVEDGLCRTDTAPGDAVARLVQATQRSAETVATRQAIRIGDLDILQADLARHRSAQRELALDVGGVEARSIGFDEEALDLAVVILRPNDRDLADTAVGDPEFGAVQHPGIALATGTRDHAARIAAVIGLGEAESTDQFPLRHARQPALLLLLGAVLVDRPHAQRALHRDEAAQAAVAAFELLHDEAVGDRPETGAAVAVQIGAEKPELRHFGNQMTRERAGAVVFLDDRQHLVVDETPDAVANEPFLLGKEAVGCVQIQFGEGRHDFLSSTRDVRVANRGVACIAAPWAMKLRPNRPHSSKRTGNATGPTATAPGAGVAALAARRSRC
jgi:hypothetical protein